ncbi:hypothetical protein [Marinobacter zhejiangensis]|uniref:Uncharacterized protein n=1 Tax=Marinobacter zhejiangensis TaxID=488535 RepID=A0A1I4MFE5_9GAMM|nr:hypothetical protein [Marinobacter zhejiangensis]SFM01988.1 hypothetical protein SAMN04487963_1048 [Marinobacter zhejiangensis]
MKHERTLPPLPRPLKLGALATLALFLALFGINQALTTEAAPKGIVSLQLAAEAERTLAILASWGEDGLLWAQTSIWLDFLFIVTFVVTLLLLTNFLLADRPGVREQKIGLWIRGAFIGAGLSDISENVLLLNNLTDPTDAISIGASVCALVKFTCLILGAAGLLVIRAERRHPLHP